MEPTTAIKLGGAAAAVAAVPLVFGVSGPTIMAACSGALFSMAYRESAVWDGIIKPIGATKLERRIKAALATLGVAFTLISSAFIASWAVLVLPHIVGGADIPRPPFAGLLGFAAQWWIPVVINSGKKALADKIEGMGK